jgi:hypothetical protein
MDLPGLVTHGNAYSRESIGPFSTSTSLCFIQLDRIIIPGKSLNSIAFLASIAFDNKCLKFLLFGRWLHASIRNHTMVIAAIGAFGLVTPLKETVLEPMQKRFYLLLLVLHTLDLLWYDA